MKTLTQHAKRLFTRVLIVAMLIANVGLTVPTAEAVTQNAYRWRNSDGNEANATWAAAENTPITGLAAGTIKRLRMLASGDGLDDPFARAGGLTLDSDYDGNDWDVTSSVSDGTYSYFAIEASGLPSQILKIDASGLSLNDKLTMEVSEADEDLNSAVIDTANGFAYFITNTNPAKVIKVRTSDMVRIATVEITGYSNSYSYNAAEIDTTNGYAYFGLNSGRVARVDINPSRTFEVEAVVAPAFSPDRYCASAIDTTRGYVYFTTCENFDDTDRAVKFDIDPGRTFQYIAAAEVFNGAYDLKAAVIDTTNQWLFVGSDTSPAQVVRIRLDDGYFFSAYNTRVILTGHNRIWGGVGLGGFGYFVTGSFGETGKVLKVGLASTPYLSTATPMDAAEVWLKDPVLVGSDILIGCNSDPVRIVKATTGTVSRTGVYIMGDGPSGGENIANTVLIDETNGYAYVGTYTSPGRIVKIDLADFSKVDSIILPTGESYLRGSVIDVTNGYAYFSTYTSPGQVVKVDISPARAFERVGAITLSGQDLPVAAVADLSNGYAYFGMQMSPAEVAKVDIDPSRTFQRVGTVTFAVGETHAYAAAIDAANGYAYFGTNTVPGIVVKVDVDPGRTFQRLDSEVLEAGEGPIYSAVADPANGYAYFGTNTVPGVLAKVDIDPGRTFQRLSSISMNVGEDGLMSGAIDTANGYAYFGTNTSPASVVKVDVNPSRSFARLDAVAFGAEEDQGVAMAAGWSEGKLYVGTSESPAKVVKLSLDLRFSLESAVKSGGSCGASTGWTPVTTTSADFQISDSVNLTNGEPTTNVAGGITDPGGQGFVAGTAVDAANSSEPVVLGSSSFTEIEWSLKAIGASGNATYCFRMTNAGQVAGFTYSSYPEVTVASNYVVAHSPASYSWTTLTSPVEITSWSNTDDGSSGPVSLPFSFNFYGQPVTQFWATTNGYISFVSDYSYYRPSIPSTSTPNGIVAGVWSDLEYDGSASVRHGAEGSTPNRVYVIEYDQVPYLGDTEYVSFQIKLFEGSDKIEIHVAQSASGTPPDNTASGIENQNGTEADFYGSRDGSQPVAMTDDAVIFALPTVESESQEQDTPPTADPTLANSVVLSRLAAGAGATADVNFTLQNTLNGLLTVTFPSGFTVIGAPTGGSACLSGFGMDAGSRTIYATKASCSGAVSLTGATVTNPSSPGVYAVSWVNDDPGGAEVVIVDDDQVSVTGNVDPTLAFDLDVSTASAETAAPYAVDFGPVAAGSPEVSDGSSIPSIWVDISTNAGGGAAVTVQSAHAALQSTSAPTDEIGSVTQALSTGTEAYGICVDGSLSGTQDGGDIFVAAAPYSGTCDGTGASVVGLLQTAAQNLVVSTGPISAGRAQVRVGVAVENTTPAHPDYSDTLTFLATATF